jgi:hypothetical protein
MTFLEASCSARRRQTQTAAGTHPSQCGDLVLGEPLEEMLLALTAARPPRPSLGQFLDQVLSVLRVPCASFRLHSDACVSFVCHGACARGREPFSSREKFGKTASDHFNDQLSRVLQIAQNPRSRGYFAERARESA